MKTTLIERAKRLWLRHQFVEASLDDRSIDLSDIVEGEDRPSAATLNGVEATMWRQLATSNRLWARLLGRMVYGDKESDEPYEPQPLTQAEFLAIYKEVDDEVAGKKDAFFAALEAERAADRR